MKIWHAALATLCLPLSLTAQTPAAPEVGPPGSAVTAPSVPPAASEAPARTVTIPAGSKVLLSLKAAVDTKAAKPGDPVYLTSTFPVIVGDHVVIPAGMDVMGVIDSVVRPGRVKGRAAVTMHFTTLVLPNGTVVDIPGSVNAVPGAGGPTVKGNENTVQQAGGKGQDARNMQTATAAGVGVGGIAGLSSGMGTGIGYGAAAGGAAGLAYTLLTRGKDVVLEVGQPVEMALQRPLVLSEKDVYVPPAGTGPQFVPADNQPKPLPKPKPE